MSKDSKINLIVCLVVCAIIIITAIIGYFLKKDEYEQSSSEFYPPIVFDVGKSVGTEYEHIEIKETEKKSYQEIAEDVINGKYGDGKERIKKLNKEGYDAEIVQKLVEDKLYYSMTEDNTEYTEETVYTEPTYTEEEYNDSGEALNPYNGVVYYGGHKETYYSQNVLPGGGLDIPGRHVAEDGTIRDENGYICVAANESYLPYGSIIETSLGTAKVYDSGCDYGTVDIYTNW